MTVKHKPFTASVSNLLDYEANSRTHSQEQITEIENSIKEFGFTNPVLVDENNIVRAGHGRLMAAANLGIDKVPAIRLIGLNETQLSALVIADNKIALNAGWNYDALKAELNFLDEQGFDLNITGFSDDELGELMEMDEGELDLSEDNPYTDKIEGIHYEPSEQAPDLSDVYDTTRYDELIANIEKAHIPDDIKYFLRLSAARHIRFNYEMVADYYAHAEGYIQELMEESALVIVDYDNAVENGYVKLNGELSEQFEKDKAIKERG